MSLATVGITQARKRARETLEISNVKQLMTALLQYTETSKQAFFPHPDIPQFLYDTNFIDRIITCPEPATSFLGKRQQYFHAYNSNGFLFHRFRGEEYSKWDPEDDANESKPHMFIPITYNKIRNPSKKIILAEADDLDVTDDYPMLGAFYPNFSFVLAEIHHNRRTVCAWGDGRASFEADPNERFMTEKEVKDREGYPYLEPEL